VIFRGDNCPRNITIWNSFHVSGFPGAGGVVQNRLDVIRLIRRYGAAW